MQLNRLVRLGIKLKTLCRSRVTDRFVVRECRLRVRTVEGVKLIVATVKLRRVNYRVLRFCLVFNIIVPLDGGGSPRKSVRKVGVGRFKL